MAIGKSIFMTVQDVSWLLVVLLICSTTVAASVLISRPGFSHFRQIAARYM